MALTLVPHNIFLSDPPRPADFWLAHLIPKEGTVLLWGHTSIGKSPLSWQLALAIANGTPFGFLAAQPGRVLYIELDTPRALVHRRAHTLPESPQLTWAFASTLTPDTADWRTLTAYARRDPPDVVFINTLRKAHAGEDVKSNVPAEVYARYHLLFPGAAIVFIHHARKASATASDQPPSEGFSGSQAWQNDATLAARLYRYKTSPDGDDGLHLALDVTKSQVSATGELLRLYLGADGVTLSPADYTVAMVYQFQHPDATMREIVEVTGMSEATCHRARRRLAKRTLELQTRDTPSDPIESSTYGNT